MTEQEWHLDKRVPVALILALVLQAGTFGWWGASIQARVDAMERDLSRLDRQVVTMADAAQVQAVQLGRIEEGISGMRRDIGRLLTVIERESER